MIHRFLATAPPSSTGFGDTLPWLAALAVLVFLGVILIMFVRRSFRADDTDGRVGFTLHDLRELRAAGQLTEEEYERAREAMIGRVRARESDASPDDETSESARETPDAPTENGPERR